MKMSGAELIPARRERVWAALNDPEVLKQAIAGCETIERTSPTTLEATVVAKVGPVKAKFKGNVTLSKLKPPESYHIAGEGKGGAAGFAKGGADVKLSEGDGGTLLSYDVDARVDGKLAQIGSRLIDSTAKKMAADFFKRFAKLAASDMVIAGEEQPTTKPRAKTSKTAAKSRAAGKAKPTAKAAAKTAATPARKAAKVEEAPPPVTAAAAAPAAETAPAAPTMPQPSPSRPSPQAGSNAWMWIVAAVIVVLLVVWFARG